MHHYFSDGYVLLSVNKDEANLKYYYVNEVANQTTLESDVTYSIKDQQGGSGKLSKLFVATVKSAEVGSDRIGPIYLEKTLLGKAKPKPKQKGVIGKFAFSGHGFGYDWNLCYSQIK